MKHIATIASVVLFFVWLSPLAEAGPCLIVTVTGSPGGPGLFNGLASPGTLVRCGDDSNNCDAVRLQFDVGRGTSLRLSQVDVQPEQLSAIFFTHMHSDQVEDFVDIMQLRWHNVGPKLDVGADRPGQQQRARLPLQPRYRGAAAGAAALGHGNAERGRTSWRRCRRPPSPAPCTTPGSWCTTGTQPRPAGLLASRSRTKARQDVQA